MAKIRNLVAAAKVSLDKDRLNAVGSRSFDVAKKCPEKNIIITTKMLVMYIQSFGIFL